MDTPASPLETPAEGSTRDALRELRERAQASLEKQRTRMRELEEQLTGQLDSAVEKLSEVVDTESQNRSGQLLTEARDEFDRERNEWQTEREENEAALNQQREELSQQAEALAQREQELEARLGELTEQQQSQANREAELSANENQLGEQREALESDRKELEQAKTELESGRANWLAEQQAADSTTDELQAELSALREELSEEKARQQRQSEHAEVKSEQIASLEAELQSARDECTELQNREKELGSERDGLQSNIAEREEQVEQLRGEVETLELTLDALRESQAESQAEANSELAERIAELERQLAEAAEAHATEQDSLEQQLSQALTLGEELEAAMAASHQQVFEGHQQERETWNAERESLLAEHDRLAEMLERVTQKLAETEASREPLEELRNKFELALADVRTLREQNSELEQELARRPKHNDEESAELIALREERDALATEVEQLQNQSTALPPTTDNQEFADLQRRFELAVEDLRELRGEKEKLEQQLAAKGNAAVSEAPPGEAKWEELKRKLLMSLEEESGEVTSERREERASIEHTIRITDDVVAAKDREIHELEEQLKSEAAAVAEAPEPSASEHLDAAIDADEAVQQARDRLAAKEAELTEKLRAAELELSVGRAKIAREQTQLAEWRIELETLRDSLATSAGNAKQGGGGRWFSKLGLGGDDS